MPQYIAIGDIHGMNQMLEALIAKLPADGELVFLGDYIDRGPATNLVLMRLLQLRQERQCHFLRGNHEDVCLKALDGDRGLEQFWLRNGGVQTLESYGGRIPDEHLHFLQQTLPYLVTDEYIFVHAGLMPGIPLEENVPESFYWIREAFLNSTYHWKGLVIHAHTPTPDGRPEIRPNRINIDTGAVYGRALTALLLPEREFISVPYQK